MAEHVADGRVSWLRETVVPALMARCWPGARLDTLHLGTAKGGNAVDGGFASSTFPVSLTLTHGEDQHVKYHLLAKVTPLEPELRAMQNSTAQFANETWWYEKAVPALLLKPCSLESPQDPEDPTESSKAAEALGGTLWPRCYIAMRHSEDLSSIVMQDLGVEGFVLARQPATELDEAHTRLALERLALLHALGYTLRQRHPHRYHQLISEIKETRYNAATAAAQRPMLLGTVQRGMTPLRADPACAELVNSLESILADPYEAMVRVSRPAPEEAPPTLCHGDFCRNNILYKYDASNQPCDLRFIDFATIREARPGTDLAFFLYLSVSPLVLRGEGMTSLLAHYHTALVTALARLLPGSADPWPEGARGLEREVGRCAPFAYCVCSFFLGVMLEGAEGFQMEDILGLSPEEQIQHNIRLGGEPATRRLVDMLIDFRDRGFHRLWSTHSTPSNV